MKEGKSNPAELSLYLTTLMAPEIVPQTLACDSHQATASRSLILQRAVKVVVRFVSG